MNWQERLETLQASKTILIRMLGGNWQYKADFTNGRWVKTNFYGPSIQNTVTFLLESSHQGYSVKFFSNS